MAISQEGPTHAREGLMRRHFRSAMRRRRALSPMGAAPVVAVLAFIVVVLAFPLPAPGDGHEQGAGDDKVRSGPVKPAEAPGVPRRHFRVKNPANLSDADAERIYAELKEDMAQRYRLSRLPAAAAYQGWTRYNRVPYRSASHGRRLLNNYANEKAHAYGRFEKAGRLPVGSVVVKDSITVTEDGAASPGPLFLMEKMAQGFNYVSGDWRYTMIMPDGSVFGITKGEGSGRVEFCIPCHLAAERHDHLHFFPAPFRRP
ncbi:MAG: cytochrome P460 family protein [Rhodospirillales bacterium]|jgi:hypothetical protein|nr:cytochrome P460 family protein [Rhodospirillales bacterium]